MECVICGKEKKYDYKLGNGSSVGVCEDCGKYLYGKDLSQRDGLTQIIRMIEYVQFSKDTEAERLIQKAIDELKKQRKELSKLIDQNIEVGLVVTDRNKALVLKLKRQ